MRSGIPDHAAAQDLVEIEPERGPVDVQLRSQWEEFLLK